MKAKLPPERVWAAFVQVNELVTLPLLLHFHLQLHCVVSVGVHVFPVFWFCEGHHQKLGCNHFLPEQLLFLSSLLHELFHLLLEHDEKNKTVRSKIDFNFLYLPERKFPC